YSGTIPPTLCDPKELVPNVFSLTPIYDNNGADFNACAFSLLLLLTTMQGKKGPFVEFLLACHAFSPLSITHHQILQYSHHNETIETTADLAFLEALQKSAPPTLNGISSAFFNLFLIKDLKPELRLEKLQTFNEQFPFSSAGTLSADLYAKALYFFVTDKITTHHIHILKLYQDDYPDLTLRYKLDLLIRIAQEEKPRQFVLETDFDPTLDPLTHLNSYKAKNYLDINVCEKFSALFPLLQSKFQEPDKLQPYLISLLRTSLTVENLDALIKNIESSPHKISESELLTFLQDPFPLYNALKLLDPKKEERVKTVIALFQDKYQKTVTRDVEKGLRAHCLSPIPNEPSEQHITYVIGRITSLNCPFSDLGLLRIFYEFLSLEKDREHIHINVEIIKLIESFIGEGQSLPPPIVADFLAYHPALTDKQHTELKNLFTNLAEYRKACMKDDSFLSPILLQKVYNALTYISDHLTDKTRQKAIQKEGKMLDLLIVPFRTFLSFASIPTSIRHVTCALPSNALPLSPANQALLPLSTCQDLSKQFYVSWEPAKDKHLLRLSLLTQKEKISYSTKITLNLPKAVFQQNPTLPFLLKRFVYHLGFDGGILDDNPEGLKNLNNFFKYAAIQEAWDAFDPAGIQKNNLRCAIYDFCDQLRVGLRMLFLNLATHCTAPQNYVERTNPQYLPKTAARGNTTFYENTHYLVPYSLIQNSPDEKKGYGTKEELNWLLDPNNSKIKQAFESTPLNETHDSQLHIILN
ncbi:MAG: hypothetical protein KDK63_01390, partial [Chlamydiia bacterium]|nr:hypothetical protein [Chlamydiia bacterium]